MASSLSMGPLTFSRLDNGCFNCNKFWPVHLSCTSILFLGRDWAGCFARSAVWMQKSLPLLVTLHVAKKWYALPFLVIICTRFAQPQSFWCPGALMIKYSATLAGFWAATEMRVAQLLLTHGAKTKHVSETHLVQALEDQTR